LLTAFSAGEPCGVRNLEGSSLDQDRCKGAKRSEIMQTFRDGNIKMYGAIIAHLFCTEFGKD